MFISTCNLDIYATSREEDKGDEGPKQKEGVEGWWENFMIWPFFLIWEFLLFLKSKVTLENSLWLNWWTRSMWNKTFLKFCQNFICFPTCSKSTFLFIISATLFCFKEKTEWLCPRDKHNALHCQARKHHSCIEIIG